MQVLTTIMLHTSAFYRAIAIPACLLWGVLEFVALQRSRLRVNFLIFRGKIWHLPTSYIDSLLYK